MVDDYTSQAEGEVQRILDNMRLILSGNNADELPKSTELPQELIDVFGCVQKIRNYLNNLSDGTIGGDLLFEGVLKNTFSEWIINNRKQLAQIQMAETREREARAMAERLRLAGEQISRNLEVDPLLETIITEVGNIIPYDAATVFLLEGKTASLRRHNGFEKFGLDPADLDGFTIDVDESYIFSQIIKTQQPVIIPDTLEYPHWPEVRFDMKRPRSWCGFPLMAENRVFGFLGLDKLDPNFYSEEVLEYLQIFAGQAALALENTRLYEQVCRMAHEDPLTGVLNRRAFFDIAQQEINRSCRYEHEVSIILLDIDYFKNINDTFGHLIGDQVLQTVADLCVDNLRNVDRFGRYGGEEFVILLPEVGLDGAAVAAERLRKQIENTEVQTQAGPVRFTISLGVAEFNQKCETLEEMLSRTDDALYRAKRSGRNRVVKA